MARWPLLGLQMIEAVPILVIVFADAINPTPLHGAVLAVYVQLAHTIYHYMGRVDVDLIDESIVESGSAQGGITTSHNQQPAVAPRLACTLCNLAQKVSYFTVTTHPLVWFHITFIALLPISQGAEVVQSLHSHAHVVLHAMMRE